MFDAKILLVAKLTLAASSATSTVIQVKLVGAFTLLSCLLSFLYGPDAVYTAVLFRNINSLHQSE